MKLLHSLHVLFTFILAAQAIALPSLWTSPAETSQDLFKRKGGGGGGGKGGGSSSSGGGKGGSSSSSGSKGGSSSSGSKGSTKPNSNTGGSYGRGSGPAPVVYGNGASYYGGGSRVPYGAGRISPLGLTPFFLTGAGLGILLASWPNGAYGYRYPNNYTYHNDTSNQNMTVPVECLCAPHVECGCDSNNQTDYVNSVANNQSIAQLANVNGTQMLFLNGTLPNGTTAASAAGSYRQGLKQLSGWWVVIAGVAYAVWFM